MYDGHPGPHHSPRRLRDDVSGPCTTSRLNYNYYINGPRHPVIHWDVQGRRSRRHNYRWNDPGSYLSDSGGIGSPTYGDSEPRYVSRGRGRPPVGDGWT